MPKRKNNIVEQKCKNCSLYNKREGICMVHVLHNGQKMNLSVEPEDDCFFQNEFKSIDKDGKEDSFFVEVDQVKIWVEDENGEKTKGNGIVKIQYPEDYYPEPKNES